MASIKHEVWMGKDELPGLFFAGKRGGKELHPEEGSVLIFSFYADSHFDAMTKYFEFMNWGKYETEFEVDKRPYDMIELTTQLERSIVIKE